MRSLPSRAALLLSLIAAIVLIFTGCGERQIYGILVVVRAEGDYAIPSSAIGADELRIEVFGKSGGDESGSWVQTALQSVELPLGAFPIAYGIVPREGDASRLYMTVVTLLRHGEALEEKIAIGTFPTDDPNRVLRFTFFDESECFQNLCREGGEFRRTTPCRNNRTECIQQCVDGECVEVEETDPDDLDPLDDDPFGDDDDSADDDDAGDDDDDDDADDDDDSVVECTEFDQCDDGDPCTDDTCDTGERRCLFMPMDCGASDECEVLACNSVSGMCEAVSATDDSECSGGICCAGACVDDDDVAHCGTCGTRCSTHETCVDSIPNEICECEPGFDDCDEEPGCEARLASDPEHCGSCETNCEAGQSCFDADGAGPEGPSCQMCSGAGQCDDDLTCTTDDCDTGVCTHTIAADSCLIDGRCYAMDEVSTTRTCAKCDPSAAQSVWSPNPGGSCVDALFCTDAETCGAAVGECDDTPRDCPTGGPPACTTGSCNEGTNSCDTGITTNKCVIDLTCYDDGDLRPDNTCQACDADTSQTAWTGRIGATCDDGLYCTTLDMCTVGGTCTGGQRNCADSLTCTMDTCNEATDDCDHVLAANKCLIGGVCYDSGAAQGASGNSRCNVCTPGMSTTTFSRAVAGTSCGALMICDGAGACVPDGGGS